MANYTDCHDGHLCEVCTELQQLRADHAESLQLIKESAQRLGMHVRAPRGPSTESESAKLLAYTNAVGEIVDDRDALRHRLDVAMEALKILGIECLAPNIGIIQLGQQRDDYRRECDLALANERSMQRRLDEVIAQRDEARELGPAEALSIETSNNP